MVLVKVRETYDLCTVQDKMTVIAIHTPKTDIIKKNYPGLLMQCKAYRPVSADVRLACASLEPLDPLQIGTEVGSISPEDAFNPILYKAMSNFGMSQLEARINALSNGSNVDVDGSTAAVDTQHVSNVSDEFPIYYGLLSDTNNWRHASPQAGLTMSDLRPLVWEMVYNVGDNVSTISSSANKFEAIGPDGNIIGAGSATTTVRAIRGGSKPMPFINTTSYSASSSVSGSVQNPGFNIGANFAEVDVPYLNVVVGAIIVPPSRLHQLFYRMVVEWTLEFSAIRSIQEVTDWSGLAVFGNATHYQNYNYSETKKVLTGTDETILENDSCMVSANVDIKKVM